MMGVYIKGMTLDEFSEYGDYCKTLIGTGQAEEVPPHGRLGDLDALMRHCVMLPRDGGSLPVVYASYVRNAPTIIPPSGGKENERCMEAHSGV